MTNADQSIFAGREYSPAPTNETGPLSMISKQSQSTFARLAMKVLSVLALMALCLSHAQATVRYVTTTGTGNGLSWAKAGALQAVITVAKSGDQIWVEKGIYVGNFTATDGVTVYGGFKGTETSLSQRNITANPTYLDANGSGTVYTIPSAATGKNTLDGFIVESGVSHGLNDSSSDTLVVSNCTFSNNTVSGNGGAVYVQAPKVTLTNCTFGNNDVAGYFNTVYGGALYIGSSTTAMVSGCTFTGNGMINEDGASGYGGGIYSAGSLTVNSSCTFTSNTALNNGGGIWAVGSALNVSDSSFTSNSNGGVGGTASNNNISGCNFSSNSGNGASFSGPNSVTVTDCTFTGNTGQTNYNGVGLYSASLVNTVTGCQFENNVAAAYFNTVYGIGAYFAAGTSSTITDCTFSGSTFTNEDGGNARGGGLAVYGTPDVERCTFSDNVSDQVDFENTGGPGSPGLLKDCLIIGTGASSSGPNGVDLGIQGGSTTFVYAVVANNTVVGTNVGINIGSGSGTGGAVSVANNVIDGNEGGLNFNAGATFVSSHNDIFGNTSYAYQGASESASDKNVDPMFVAPATGDYHLAAGSPLIDMGDDSYVTPGDTDLDGNPRIQGLHVDIGCYETSVTVSGPVITMLNPHSVPAGSGSFVLMVFGKGFGPDAVADWNGAARPTMYVSPTKVEMLVFASDVATAGHGHVTVTTGGQTSASSAFVIASTSIVPFVSVTRDSASGTLNVTVTLANAGGATAKSVAITKALIGSTATTTTLPLTVGDIPVMSTGSASLSFAGSAGATGSKATITVNGTFNGGDFVSSSTVTLP